MTAMFPVILMISDKRGRRSPDHEYDRKHSRHPEEKLDCEPDSTTNRTGTSPNTRNRGPSDNSTHRPRDLRESSHQSHAWRSRNNFRKKTKTARRQHSRLQSPNGRTSVHLPSNRACGLAAPQRNYGRFGLSRDFHEKPGPCKGRGRGTDTVDERRGRTRHRIKSLPSSYRGQANVRGGTRNSPDSKQNPGRAHPHDLLHANSRGGQQ